jgi:hypothetical protein
MALNILYQPSWLAGTAELEKERDTAGEGGGKEERSCVMHVKPSRHFDVSDI